MSAGWGNRLRGESDPRTAHLGCEVTHMKGYSWTHCLLRGAKKYQDKETEGGGSDTDPNARGKPGVELRRGRGGGTEEENRPVVGPVCLVVPEPWLLLASYHKLFQLLKITRERS